MMTRNESSPATILIVDDNPENLALLTALLAQKGHEVRTTISGDVALRAALKHVPDLVLADIDMPGVSGFQVCERLKADERTRDVPVILSGAEGSTMDIIRTFSVGAVDHVTKPFREMEVLARVETHLTLRRALQELSEANAQLEKTAQDLRERVKELNCLYGLSNLVDTPGIRLEEIVKGTVALIPPSWQYPEITCARIELAGKETRSQNWQESPWQQSADVMVRGERCGTIEVGYLAERTAGSEDAGGEGPFLKEERFLLDAIAERLGRIVERFQAQEQAGQPT